MKTVDPHSRKAATAWRRKPDPRAHHLIHWLFAQIEEQHVHLESLHKQVGINRYQTQSWLKGGFINMQNFDYMLSVFGYRLTIEKLEPEPCYTNEQVNAAVKAYFAVYFENLDSRHEAYLRSALHDIADQMIDIME